MNNPSNQPLSNCHGAPTQVNTADEGTSIYICSECHKACDVYVAEQFEPKCVYCGEPVDMSLPGCSYNSLLAVYYHGSCHDDQPEPKKTEHPETYCHRCGGPNLSWSCSSPLWNAVMRGNDINGEWKWDEIICPTCFALLSNELGITDDIFVTTKRPKVQLTTTTPSGRIWSEEEGLWIEPVAQANLVISEQLDGLVEVARAERDAAVRAALIDELRSAQQFNRTINNEVLDELLETYFDDRIQELARLQPPTAGEGESV